MEVERYEKVWIVLSLLLLVAFLAAIAVTVFAYGINLPGMERRVDPRRLLETPPFREPGVRETGPGQYAVYLVGRIWMFAPNEIRVPAGSKVTFHATSGDVTHGFSIRGTNINLMLIPGHVARASAIFERPGEYLFLCHEYCGVGHQVMAGKVIVEAKR